MTENEQPGKWSEIEIAGKKADVYVPANPVEHPTGVLFLHNHEEETLRENSFFTQEFEKHGIHVICPHGKRSWWLDRICTEFDSEITPMNHLLENVVPEFSRRWGIETSSVGLLGIGMGGQGVLQFSYRYPRKFPVVAAIAPAVDMQSWYGKGFPLDEMFDSWEAVRQETALLRLNPLNWPRHQMLYCDPEDNQCFEGSERLLSKLYSMGIMFQRDFETSAGGYCWEYFNQMASPSVEFITKGLSDYRE